MPKKKVKPNKRSGSKKKSRSNSKPAKSKKNSKSNKKNNWVHPVLTKRVEEHQKILRKKRHLTLGQKAADKLAVLAGSWTFILGLILALILWAFLNTVAWVNNWDPYPFILLNLFLSCLAAIQAPVILMSQNRQAERDRQKNELDLAITKKSEYEIRDMQQDLEEIKKLIKKFGKK